MAKGKDRDWKYNTIFLSQELQQANVDSLEDDSSESDSEVAVSDMCFDISTARPGTSQQPCYKCPRLCRSFGSTDLLSVHQDDHRRSSLHILKGALVAHSDHITELPGGEKWNNNKGKDVMDVEDVDTREGAVESGTQAREESLGSLSKQEEEEGTRSPARTGAHTTDSEKYKQKECRGVEMESDSVKWKMDMVLRSVQTVQETLITLMTLVESQIFNNHSNRISANPNPHMPTTTSTTTAPTPTKLPAVTTPAQPAPVSHHPHPPVHPPTPLNACHPGAQPYHPDILAEPPSCGQRSRENAAAFRILTEPRAQQAVSVFFRMGEQLETLGAVEREAHPGSAHLSTSVVSGSPLLCQRCQAEITQTSETEV
ncbi:uncharacterized protein LOC143488598 isoform X2 [Brachyhypopomus gauderio]|uniref:uncharacterized protein LOC143488598 isoform X2 n=1 Tax=Brachyhypopomus gauderio TaxID=698409 RepID=UPI0040422FFF